MENTKIDWCDSTWNPVTGCLHGCEYCYARGFVNRFKERKGYELNEGNTIITFSLDGSPTIYEAKEPSFFERLEDLIPNPDDRIKAPYPYGFSPTFHRYRLNDYIDKKGRNIFVCSMADLFGKWVPDDWKIEVLQTCYQAPQHNYLFLTKNPDGYCIHRTEKHGNFDLDNAYTENMWLGITYTGKERLKRNYEDWEIGNGLTIWANFWYLWRMSNTRLPTKAHKFISIEPLACDICEVENERYVGKLLEYFLLPKGRKSFFEWIIVGAETGNRKDKVVPEREWLEKLVELCRKADIPLFMKSSLADIWGEPLIQEFPESLKERM